MTSWKTTLGGITLVLTASADIIGSAAKGIITPNLQADIVAIIGGFSLIFAKDYNVTGTPPK